jgi:protein tyrosine phosphatase
MAPNLKDRLRHPIAYSREVFQKFFKHRNSFTVKKKTMGNQTGKESSSTSNSNSNSSSDFNKAKIDDALNKAIEHANITGKTWDALASNLEKHITTEQLNKEWEILTQKEELLAKEEHLVNTATKMENKAKNRYLNILPYDATRVKLRPVEGEEDSDYINANWVTSAERKYICTQAPLENTLDDFYRMLWETNSSALVMLTRLIELGRIKAHEYLPRVGDEPKKYGDIEVEVISEENGPNESYIKRKFTLKKGGDKHELAQYHFLAWPDHGTPTETETLLTMILDADSNLPSELSHERPTVVHCSAGVGRTGTYVIINSILEQITNSMKRDPTTPPTINLMKTLTELRTMRTSMVNHPDQYEFCYRTLLDHVKRLISQKH